MTKEERARKETEGLLPGTVRAKDCWLMGYDAARKDFSKDDGFITKEYFRGYEAAIENIKAFVFNVTRDDPDATFTIKSETEIYLFSHKQDRKIGRISIRDVFTRYLNDVQANYNRLKRQLGGK